MCAISFCQYIPLYSFFYHFVMKWNVSSLDIREQRGRKKSRKEEKEMEKRGIKRRPKRKLNSCRKSAKITSFFIQVCILSWSELLPFLLMSRRYSEGGPSLTSSKVSRLNIHPDICRHTKFRRIMTSSALFAVSGCQVCRPLIDWYCWVIQTYWPRNIKLKKSKMARGYLR